MDDLETRGDVEEIFANAFGLPAVRQALQLHACCCLMHSLQHELAKTEYCMFQRYITAEVDAWYSIVWACVAA